VCGVGFQAAVRGLNVYLRKKPVPLRDHFDNIPMALGPWESVGKTQKLTAELVEELGTELYLDRTYAIDGDASSGWVQLHVAYYTGMIDTVPHVPDRCLVAGGFNARSRPKNLPMELAQKGWRLESYESDEDVDQIVTFPDSITRAPVTVRMPRGDFKLRTTEFSLDEKPDARIYAGYFFIANGRIAITPEDVKLIAFKKSEEYAYYCKVQFFAIGDPDFEADDFVSLSADCLDELLPELMRCLPDWPEVEAKKEDG